MMAYRKEHKIKLTTVRPIYFKNFKYVFQKVPNCFFSTVDDKMCPVLILFETMEQVAF